MQGQFDLGRLNLLFVFQVNCPGCFLYGFPIVNQLYLEHKNEINFLGLSTAFEDFDLNTQKNTKLLLEEKILVGEAEKALNQQGFDVYPKNIDFPIAMDVLNSQEEFITNENINTICHLNPNYKIWPLSEQEVMRKKVQVYLSSNAKIPFTFTINQLRGTPSYILFNKELTILEQWFGHKDLVEVNELLAKWLVR